MNNSNAGQQTRTWKREAIIAGSLFLVAVAALIIVAVTSHRSAEIAEAEWQTTLESAEAEQQALQGKLTTLEDDYTVRIAENEELQADIETKLEEISTLQQNVAVAERKLRESKKNTEAIRNRLAELEDLKIQLEQDMATLTEEKTELENTNQQLQKLVASSEKQVEMLSEEVAELTSANTALKERIANVAPAGFTADNFVITAHRRNDKLTSKARKAEKINVSFDIAHVPEAYGKDHEIYLVLTDFHGMSPENVPTIDATVSARGEQWAIEAADIEKIMVDGQESITMTISPEDDLEPGTYNLLVYADNGFLGATGFHLR